MFELYLRNCRSNKIQLGTVVDVEEALRKVTKIDGKSGGVVYALGPKAKELLAHEAWALPTACDIQIDLIPHENFKDSCKTADDFVGVAMADGYELLTLEAAMTFFVTEWKGLNVVRIPVIVSNGELKIVWLERDYEGGCGYYIEDRRFGCEEGNWLAGSVGGRQTWYWAFVRPEGKGE